MSLNDQREKLDLAEKYLIDYQAHSQEFESALEHLRWVYLNDSDSVPYIAQIFKRVKATAEERREFSKVKELSNG